MIVLIAVQEKTVAVTDSLNAAPITGRQAIFARVATNTETRLDVEIVGVYSTLDLAGQARANHAQTHPGRRYLQKVTHLDADDAAPPAPAECIRCHTTIDRGSFCAPCQAAYWKELREGDPEIPTEPMPLIPATAGMETRFVAAR